MRDSHLPSCNENPMSESHHLHNQVYHHPNMMGMLSSSFQPIHQIRKRNRRQQKKAPGAPKRGKSPYIFFSMDKREEIKKALSPGTRVTEIVKAIAKEWAKLSDEERKPWIDKAERDKLRYEDEMATYDGPLRVPKKRSSKQLFSYPLNDSMLSREMEIPQPLPLFHPQDEFDLSSIIPMKHHNYNVFNPSMYPPPSHQQLPYSLHRPYSSHASNNTNMFNSSAFNSNHPNSSSIPISEQIADLLHSSNQHYIESIIPPFEDMCTRGLGYSRQSGSGQHYYKQNFDAI